MLKVSAPLCVWNNSEASAQAFVCIQDKFPLLLLSNGSSQSLVPDSTQLFSLLCMLNISFGNGGHFLQLLVGAYAIPS